MTAPTTSTSTSASEPFFSVVTVVFKDRKGIELTHRSILSQTCRDFEWVIVDGGSPDQTVDYIRAIEEPRPRWVSERDKGIYDGMNKGTAMSRGRYVIYMNAGDGFCDPGALEAVKAVIESSGNPDLCYAGCNFRFEDGSRRLRPPRPLAKAIRHGIPAVHQASFYRREFLDVPPYELKYRVSSDYFISARCFLKGATACYLNQAIADFAVGGNSMQKSYESLREAWWIQRDVLGLGLLSRCWSASRRFVAHRVLDLLHSRSRK